MKPKNAVMLLLTSLIWGTAFVAQSVGMDFLEPFTFNGVRSFIGGVTLLPCIWLLEKDEWEAGSGRNKKRSDSGRNCLWSAFICSKQPPTDGDSVHNSRKGGIYYRILYCVCSGSWDISKESSRLESVDVSISGTDRAVFLMY